MAEFTSPPADTCPVTVLTGFLGSGKTTLLAQLLRQPALARTAVVINEFGAVGLDHELLDHSQDELVLLSNGCVCCTVRGDLQATLQRLQARRAQDPAWGVDRVLIETTGLANPAPILHTLMADEGLRAHFHLERLITTVDAVNGAATLAAHPVALEQVALADRLVLTKTDLADAPTQAALRATLRQLNPRAPLRVARHGALAAELLLGDGPWQPRLNTPCAACAAGDALEAQGEPGRGGAHAVCTHGPGEDDAAHDHDHAVHDSGIQSFSLTLDEPLPWDRFQSWLDLLQRLRGPDLLRFKGLVAVQGQPGPVVVHGVQHLIHPPHTLPAWPGADHRTRLVFITRGVAREDVEFTLRLLTRHRARSAAPAERLAISDSSEPGPTGPQAS
ncbi:CobW family GTP-binding protein [Ideonella livida]|uniref:GTP-binding protein n=1 Tax=Ideonella livida TaxID=2707176 RepID=A0A7C9PHY1_9BURK|nr:GTP-binding protein [Ideonella livida]NDY92437.1 GTP-binding protein [Ideonella livida]